MMSHSTPRSPSYLPRVSTSKMKEKAQYPRNQKISYSNFEARGLLGLDKMDSWDANNSKLKSTHHQSDIDYILSILVGVVCVSTQEEVCIFIFIYFCSFFKARSAYISLQVYYLHECPIAVTSTPHPWPDHWNDVLSCTSEENLRRQQRIE